MRNRVLLAILAFLITAGALFSFVACGGDDHEHSYTVKSTDSKYLASPILTKAGITSVTYFATDIAKHKVVPLELDAFLRSNRRKAVSYGFAICAWCDTLYSIASSDPILRANQRGYALT